MSSYFDLHATRPFGRKLNAVIEFIRYNSKPFGKSMLFIAGPFILVGSVLLTQFLNQTIMQSVRMTQGAMVEQNPFSVISILSLLGGVAAVFIGSVVLVSTVYEYMVLYDRRKSNQIEVIDVWNRVKRNMWPLLLTLLVFGVIIFVAYFILLMFMGLITMIHPVFSVFTFFGFMILALFATAYFMMVIFVQVYEGKGMSNAFQRASFLIKDNLWSTVGIIFVTSLIQSTISTAFVIPMYANIIVYTLHNTSASVLEEPGTMFMVINYISLAVYLLANYLLYAIPLLGVAFQYFNLAEKKEARGLMDRLESFGAVETDQDNEEHY